MWPTSLVGRTSYLSSGKRLSVFTDAFGIGMAGVVMVIYQAQIVPTGKRNWRGMWSVIKQTSGNFSGSAGGYWWFGSAK